MSQTSTGYESYNLAIALHETAMRKTADGKTTYHARPIIRKSVDMDSVANDMITTGALSGYSVEQILAVWSVLNNAIVDRVMNGAIVDGGIGTYYPTVHGSFTGLTDTFDTGRHSIDIGFRISKDTKELISDLRPATVSIGNTTVPEVTGVVDFETGADDQLTPGGFLTITGKNIKVNGTNDDVGLYFTNLEDGSKSVKVTADRIGINTGTKLALNVPALEAGSYQISIVTQPVTGTWTCKSTRTYTIESEFTVIA